MKKDIHLKVVQILKLSYVYEEWGVNGFKMLEGIFSFAIWDNSLKKLFLIRDRLGVKPLYYAKSD